jgi:hypothetical protein
MSQQLRILCFHPDFLNIRAARKQEIHKTIVNVDKINIIFNIVLLLGQSGPRT